VEELNWLSLVLFEMMVFENSSWKPGYSIEEESPPRMGEDTPYDSSSLPFASLAVPLDAT